MTETKGARYPLSHDYLEQMRAHVDEGGTLTHKNAVDLLGEVGRLHEGIALFQRQAHEANIRAWRQSNRAEVVERRCADLIAALRGVVKWLDNGGCMDEELVLKPARAAVARATGERE